MLYRQTAGHPLFTIELLRGLQERGDLLLGPGILLGRGDDTWIGKRFPARVEAVIAERISRLPQSLLSILQVACVEGEMFTAEVVGRVRTIDVQDVLRRLSGELDRKHRLISVHEHHSN